MPNLDLTITKIMRGDTEVMKIMQGDTHIWPQCTTNGLVYHFDGINKGSNNTRWTDLVSGEYFTLNSHASVDADSVIMDGNGCLSGSSGMNISYSVGTIEVCIEASSSTGIIFFSSGTSGLSALLAGAGMGFSGERNCQYNFTKVSKFTWSANDQMCLYNGTKYTTKSNNTWSHTATVAGLGGRTNANSYYFAGKIHSIRIYNRKLSEAEMLNNQKVDNIRFNMGIDV